MVDIETLDNVHSAVVLSIGWCWFDRENPERAVSEGRHYVLSTQEQERNGRTISGGTVAWWMQQSESAKSIFSNRTPKVPPPSVVMELFKDVEEADAVWANGPDFDGVILANLLKDYAPYERWPFWKHRCVRTFKNIFSDFIGDIKNNDVHNALADAKFQAEQMRAIFQTLKNKGINAR